VQLVADYGDAAVEPSSTLNPVSSEELVLPHAVILTLITFRSFCSPLLHGAACS